MILLRKIADGFEKGEMRNELSYIFSCMLWCIHCWSAILSGIGGGVIIKPVLGFFGVLDVTAIKLCQDVRYCL